MEQLQHLNTKVETLNTLQEKQIKLNATNFIGLEVSYSDNSMKLVDEESSTVNYKLHSDTKSTKAKIMTANGETVRELDLGSLTKGSYPLSWDGLNNNGEKMNNGEYKVEIIAASDNGGQVHVDLNRSRRIDQVSFTDNTPKFHLGDKVMGIDEINVYDKKVSNLLGNGIPFPIKKEVQQ